MMQTKHNWTKEEILAIYNKPMMELLFDAATVHRANHNPNQVQVSTLLSIKTGGCPEDCGYCPQAARYHTDIEGNDLMSVSQVKAQAFRAKSSGSSRVCMGAAWRNVKDGPEFDQCFGDGSYHQQTRDGSMLYPWYDYRKSSTAFSRSWFVRLQP